MDLKRLLDKQAELNTGINGGVNVKYCKATGKKIDWRLAIVMECAELIDSLNWKHWSEGQVDMHNAKVEVVDILHFVLSLIVDSRLEVGAADVVAIFIPDVYNESKGCSDTNKTVRQIKSLMKATLKGKDPIFILFKLFRVAISLDLTVEQLEKLYWGKNILNKFRQDNGYAEGAYSKHWNGVEDNVILLRLLEEDVKDIYGELDKLYKGT